MMNRDAKDATPEMPTKDVKFRLPHRQKIGPHQWPINACVARPVGKAEIKAQPEAQKALQKKWDRLKIKKVWDLDPKGVFEWRDVAAKARREGKEVHMGMLYEICVEKGSELTPELRKYRGRIVVLGNQVKNQN